MITCFSLLYIAFSSLSFPSVSSSLLVFSVLTFFLILFTSFSLSSGFCHISLNKLHNQT
jgi:hypothetical protein